MRELILFTLFILVLVFGYTRVMANIRRKTAQLEKDHKYFDWGENSHASVIVAPIVVALLVAVVALPIFSRAWVQVGPARTMAIYDPFGGGIAEADYSEGWHLAPIWASRKFYDTCLEEYTMSGKYNEGSVMGDDSMMCQTAEGLVVKLDGTVAFKIPFGGGNQIWRTVGPDYLNIFVRPTVRNVVKLTVSKYRIMEVYSNAPTQPHGKEGVDYYLGKRQQIEDEVTAELAKQFKAKGLELVTFLLRDVAYEPNAADPNTCGVFEAAILNKQIAQQSVVTQSYYAEAAKIRAQSKAMRAEGEAKAIELKSQALATEPKLVGLEWIEALDSDPEKPREITVIMLPKGGVTPLLHMNAGALTGAGQ